MYQTETIIALGSNLGNAIFNLRRAVRELENIGNIKKFANIYWLKCQEDNLNVQLFLWPSFFAKY